MKKQALSLLGLSALAAGIAFASLTQTPLAETKASSPTITPTSSGLSVPQPEEHPLSSMVDGNDSTWAWFHTATSGCYIQFDYGADYRFSALTLLTGYGESFGDTFNGNVKISEDGATFYKIGSFTTAEHAFSVDLSANGYYFRYVRITDISAETWMAVREITGTISGDTSAFASVSVSSNMTLVGDGYGVADVNTATDIVDNDIDTFAWYNRVTSANAYIQLDLGSTKSVSSLQFLQSRKASPSDYAQTAITFAYATAADGPFTTIATSASAHQHFLSFDPVEARYIRASLSGTESSVSNDFIIRDFSVNPIWPIRYSSDLKIYDDYRQGYALSNPSYGVDGNEATFVDFDGTNRGASSWFELDSQKAVTFDKINLITGKETGDKVTACTLSYSTDGISYTDIGAKTSNDGTFSVTLPNKLTARYLRASALSSGWMSINEFNVTTQELEAFLNYVTALSCADIATVSGATTAKQTLENDYAALSSADIANIPAATLAKYTYMHSYCQYVITNNVSGLGQNLSQEDTDRYLLAGLVCVAAFSGAMAIFFRKKNKKD